MVTSKKDANKASKQLASPKSTSAEKSVAGSDLAQAKGKGKTPQKTAKTATGTSSKDASKASKQLASPKSTSAEKSVAGSDLAQVKGKGKGGTSGKATKKKKKK